MGDFFANNPELTTMLFTGLGVAVTWVVFKALAWFKDYAKGTPATWDDKIAAAVEDGLKKYMEEQEQKPE